MHFPLNHISLASLSHAHSWWQTPGTNPSYLFWSHIAHPQTATLYTPSPSQSPLFQRHLQICWTDVPQWAENSILRPYLYTRVFYMRCTGFQALHFRPYICKTHWLGSKQNSSPFLRNSAAIPSTPHTLPHFILCKAFITYSVFATPCAMIFSFLILPHPKYTLAISIFSNAAVLHNTCSISFSHLCLLALVCCPHCFLDLSCCSLDFILILPKHLFVRVSATLFFFSSFSFVLTSHCYFLYSPKYSIFPVDTIYMSLICFIGKVSSSFHHSHVSIPLSACHTYLPAHLS